MDLLEAKSRIAEALVESIFRRARYEVTPFRSGSSLTALTGASGGSPFTIRSQLTPPSRVR